MIGDRWGVRDSEVARTYPCDQFVPDPALQAWRGVTVHAPASMLWQWVKQVRLAPYSYDWIDNLGRKSPRALSNLAEPQVGDSFTTAGGRDRGEVVSVLPGQHLTATIMGAYLSYVLVEEGADTRLLLKIVLKGNRWAAPAASIGDLIMSRRQLLNLKHLAEH